MNVDPEIVAILKRAGLGGDALWLHKQSGKHIMYHWACEKAGAAMGVRWAPPAVIQADAVNKLAVVLVTGHLGDVSEWAFGEAAPYNTTQTYPFAMAEKRGKDRVILKLLGLHGQVYSDAEAEEFANGRAAPHKPTPQPSGEHAQDRVTPALQPRQDRDSPAPATASAGDARQEPAATTAAGPARRPDAQQQRAATIAGELEAAGPKLPQVWLKHWPEIEGLRKRLRERLEEKRDELMRTPAGLREIEGVTYDPLPADDPDDTAEAVADLEGRDEDPRQGELMP